MGNPDKMAEIMWEDDEDPVPTDSLLSSVDRVVTGSRFAGLTMDDIPMWLRALMVADVILNIGGTIHFYTGAEGGWYSLRSTVTLSLLARKLDLYAPVNFAIAAEPFVNIIESVSWPAVVLSSTFTQGRLRYAYTLDDETQVVNFAPNVVFGREPNAKNTLCSIPVTNVNPILQFNLKFSIVRARKSGAVSWLHRVFGDNINTILWALGDMLYDSNNKRMFILYGPGGVGKSTVATIMNAVIGGTIPTLNSELAAINPRSFRRDVLSKKHLDKTASTRLISLGDVEPRHGDILHMQNIKVLTGGDEVDGMIVHTTLIMTANKLFHYDDLNQFVQPDRLRRVVVIPSVEERDGVNADIPPIHQDILDELVQYAVRTRIMQKRPPVKVDALLASLFQSSCIEASEVVCIDEEAALYECMTATMLLCWRFGLEVGQVSKCLKWVGCCCAVESGGVYFIARNKPLTGVSISHTFEDPDAYSYSKDNGNKVDRANIPLFG